MKLIWNACSYRSSLTRMVECPDTSSKSLQRPRRSLTAKSALFRGGDGSGPSAAATVATFRGEAKAGFADRRRIPGCPAGLEIAVVAGLSPLTAKTLKLFFCRVSSAVICFFVTTHPKYVSHLLILKAVHYGHRVANAEGWRFECRAMVKFGSLNFYLPDCAFRQMTHN